MPNILKSALNLSLNVKERIKKILEIEDNVANNKGSSKLRAYCDQLGYKFKQTINVAIDKDSIVSIKIISLAPFMVNLLVL